MMCYGYRRNIMVVTMVVHPKVDTMEYLEVDMSTIKAADMVEEEVDP